MSNMAVVVKVIVTDIVDSLISQVNGVTPNLITKTAINVVKLMTTVNVHINSVGVAALYFSFYCRNK